MSFQVRENEWCPFNLQESAITEDSSPERPKKRFFRCLLSKLSFEDNVRRLIELALIVMLLMPLDLAGGLTLGPAEKAWSKTFVAPASNSIALRGVIGLANAQVNGSFTVRSCCGYSTNGIKFSILNVDFSGFKDYGVVVDSLNFSWNTGTSDEYQMTFDNTWGQICKGNSCGPDPSHPSSHNKTIELHVREVAPGAFLSVLTPSVIASVLIVLAIGLALSSVVVLRERKRRQQNARS